MKLDLLQFSVLTAVCTALFLGVAGDAKADVIDSYNVGLSTFSGVTWGAKEVGWFYTPSVSYLLTGIDTQFDSVDVRTVTAELRSVPSAGVIGDILTSGDFTPSTSLSGATFAVPVSLNAGTTYFFGFRNVQDLGVNVTDDPGATAVSELRFGPTTEGYYDYTESDDQSSNPVVAFNGVVIPEGSTATLLGLALPIIGAVAGARRRKR